MELSLISCGEAVSYNFKFEYNEFIQFIEWYYDDTISLNVLVVQNCWQINRKVDLNYSFPVGLLVL